MSKLYSHARINAYVAMSSTASRMSAIRTYGTAPGSPERVALADLVTRMDDLRAAFSIAVERGDLARVSRNGYRRVF